MLVALCDLVCVLWELWFLLLKFGQIGVLGGTGDSMLFVLEGRVVRVRR
jgi:hypothetical protein